MQGQRGLPRGRPSLRTKGHARVSEGRRKGPERLAREGNENVSTAHKLNMRGERGQMGRVHLV